MRKHLLALAVVLALFLGGLFASRNLIREEYRAWQRGPIPAETTRKEVIETISDVEITPSPALSEEVMDESPEALAKGEQPHPTKNTKELNNSVTQELNLKMVFVPQAPTLIWDEIHEDTCEEASMLMIEAYLNDRVSYEIDEMEADLQEHVAWQTERGDEYSISSERVAEIMRTKMGIETAKVVEIDSIEDVKNALRSGNPIILPAAGKELQNPYFRNGGPLYHMLVAKGFTEKTIITNDPGTRRGENYAYDQETLWDAIHDWNDGDVENGKKVMITVGE